jgi:hypothetical protein
MFRTQGDGRSFIPSFISFSPQVDRSGNSSFPSTFSPHVNKKGVQQLLDEGGSVAGWWGVGVKPGIT